MKNFVKLIQRVHEERFSVVMEKIVTRKIPVTFLSIAPVSQAVEITKILRAQGLNVSRLVIIDETPPPTNLDFEIVNVNDVAQIYPQPEYIFVYANIDARIATKNFPASKVISLDMYKAEQAYEMFMTHLPELKEVYESLIDEESKKTFRGYWLVRTLNQLGEIIYSNAAHYLINGFIPERGAIAIDCGVYDGGTATVFAEMGYKVYGFEMDAKNYERSIKVAEQKNFLVENLGLGAYNHSAHYDLTGTTGSKINENGAGIAKIITLDSYVREKNLSRVDFIKMDVEGAELDVLKGAVTTIARFKPILALSAYHKLDDFWMLMNFVKSIRPDYEFAMHQFVRTPEDEPEFFKNGLTEYLLKLGLEPEYRTFGECVLFAR